MTSPLQARVTELERDLLAAKAEAGLIKAACEVHNPDDLYVECKLCGRDWNDDEPAAHRHDCPAADANAPLATALLTELSALREKQRTEGTVEVCRLCNGRDFMHDVCSYSAAARYERKRPEGCPATPSAQGDRHKAG